MQGIKFKINQRNKIFPHILASCQSRRFIFLVPLPYIMSIVSLVLFHFFFTSFLSFSSASKSLLCSFNSTSDFHLHLHNHTVTPTPSLQLDTYPFTQLVVSWCTENISWLESELPHFDSVYLYSKCDTHLSLPPSSPFFTSSKVKIISLPNVGVCDHTYLHHIIYNWDELANWTVFYKGHFEGKCPPNSVMPPAKFRYELTSDIQCRHLFFSID